MANDKTKGEKLRERELEQAQLRLRTLKQTRATAAAVARQEDRIAQAERALARATQFRETGSPFGAGGLPAAEEPKEEPTAQEAVREAVRRRRARERVARQASGG